MHDPSGDVEVHREAPASAVLIVVTASSTYFPEDGTMFGVGADQGHLYRATCRMATDEEATPLLAREAETARQTAALARRQAAEDALLARCALNLAVASRPKHYVERCWLTSPDDREKAGIVVDAYICADDNVVLEHYLAADTHERSWWRLSGDDVIALARGAARHRTFPDGRAVPFGDEVVEAAGVAQ